jgi:hypothetical protein
MGQNNGLELPEEVNEGEMLKPTIVSTGNIDYSSIPSEMIDEDAIIDGIGEGMDELEDEVDDMNFDDSDEDHFGIADLEAEFFLEMWEDARHNLHSFAYNQTLYKDGKAAKKIARKLSLKKGRTPKEDEYLKALWEYCDQHDECKSRYMEAVPYTGKHRDLTLRFIDLQLKKLRASGKKVPEWIIFMYLFAAPEVKAISRLFVVKDDIPEFRFDPSDLK